MNAEFRPENWSDDVLDQAVAWHVELSASPNNPIVIQGWKNWLNSHKKHENAWQQLSYLNLQMEQLPPGSAQNLQRAEQISMSRRRILKGALAVGAAAPALWLLQRQPAWQAQMADFSTIPGEFSELSLFPDMKVNLNTQTAVNLDLINPVKKLELIRGELYVQQEQTNSSKLSITFNGNRLQAYNAELNLRLTRGLSTLDVYAGQVEVELPFSGQALYLKAGEAVSISSSKQINHYPAEANHTAWLNKMLIVEDWSLQQFCQEIERYMPGKVYCAEAVSQLRISGSFPLTEPKQLLTELHKSLPVSTRFLSDYWVILEAA